MIKKAARIHLSRAQADLAFAEAKTLQGAKVEMIPEGGDLFTVTVVWDNSGAAVADEEATAFIRDESPSDLPAVGDGTGPQMAAFTGAAPAFRLGDLSKRFESNGNPGAIGHDSTGGPSYGEYQIATKTGTMDAFLRFLAATAPPFAAALDAAGGGAAARTETPEFRDAWRLAAQDPAFATSQHDFIQATHYAPFARRLDNDLGFRTAARSGAVQNVVWSVAVQHGAANRVFHNAFAGKSVPGLDGDKAVINAVYDERSNLGKYFTSSKPQVLAGLTARFVAERKLALLMLG